MKDRPIPNPLLPPGVYDGLEGVGREEAVRQARSARNLLGSALATLEGWKRGAAWLHAELASRLEPVAATLSSDDEPECPGEHCMMCNGEACALCGAGCWNNDPNREPCDHDVLERHTEPDGRLLPRER